MDYCLILFVLFSCFLLDIFPVLIKSTEGNAIWICFFIYLFFLFCFGVLFLFCILFFFIYVPTLNGFHAFFAGSYILFSIILLRCLLHFKIVILLSRLWFMILTLKSLILSTCWCCSFAISVCSAIVLYILSSLFGVVFYWGE